jgi:hypothetical protein
MINQGDENQLRKLEESLWIAETRFDKDYMNRVLAPDFFEFGRSGRRYRREDTLSIEAQKIRSKLPLQDFAIHPLDQDHVLVTYISEVKYGEVERANRSSIWSRTPEGWKIRFHQGTPIQ